MYQAEAKYTEHLLFLIYTLSYTFLQKIKCAQYTVLRVGVGCECGVCVWVRVWVCIYFNNLSHTHTHTHTPSRYCYTYFQSIWLLWTESFYFLWKKMNFSSVLKRQKKAECESKRHDVLLS